MCVPVLGYSIVDCECNTRGCHSSSLVVCTWLHNTFKPNVMTQQGN